MLATGIVGSVRRPLVAASLAGGTGVLVGGSVFLRRRRHRMRRVRDAMTANPRTVEPSMPVAQAARLMKDSDIGALPVVEDGRLVGVLTDRDIVVRAVAEGGDPQAVPVREVASRELITIDPEQPLDEALRLMARRRVRRLPVVEGTRLVGILAQADVALESEEHKVGEAIGRISEPSAA
jgi:CBS domain-containing protein